MNILKHKHAAGGHYFTITNGKGNTRYGRKKVIEIAKNIIDPYSEGVYLTKHGVLGVQLLNGVFKPL